MKIRSIQSPGSTSVLNNTLNSVVKKLNKLNITLLPYIDREIETIEKNYGQCRRALYDCYKKLKQLNDEFRSKQFDLKKQAYIQQLLKIIYEIVEKINMGEVTLKNIQTVVQDVDNFSLTELKSKIRVYEDVRDKYLFL